MKKIVIAACVVALAVAAQASAFDWKTGAASSNKLLDGTGDTTSYYSGTAYLFSAADFTQQAILSAWDSGTFSTDKAISTRSVKDGKISASPAFSWGSPGDVLTAFVVVDAGDRFFISDTQQGAGTEATTKTFSYNLGTNSSTLPIEFEKGSAKFIAQGWYKSTGGGVPEPTSGLLLVLGMAGLALRRRRA